MLEYIKSFFSYTVSCIAETICSTHTFFLPTTAQHVHLSAQDSEIRAQFRMLSQAQQEQVHYKIWELGKMDDARISGPEWGKEHALDSMPRLHRALCRLGFFRPNPHAQPMRCLPLSFGEGPIPSQYYSLTERAARESHFGQMSYVNGMGVPTVEHAGRDAAGFSDRFAGGSNLHCVYHTTHQATPAGDLFGLFNDLLRMQAVEGGSYTRTSYLIAQQWIDYLDRNPTKNYLQIAHSEGAVHVNAALRLINQSRPDLLKRLRILAFCPAHFILPETYGQGLQVKSFYKMEDCAINPWAKGIGYSGSSPHIVVVRHTGDHPHNPLSSDFISAGKRYVDQFLRSGDIYGS